MKEIKDFLESYTQLLPSDKGISPFEAERRAAQFLVACAHIANWRHLYGQEKIRTTSLERAVYSNVLSVLGGSKITESKIKVEAAPEYLLSREALETSENDLNFLKTYYEIFLNAHIQYRNMAKSEGGS